MFVIVEHGRFLREGAREVHTSPLGMFFIPPPKNNLRETLSKNSFILSKNYQKSKFCSKLAILIQFIIL